MAINVGSAVAYLELDTSKFKKGFASAKNDLKIFADETATAGQKIQGVANSMSTVGSVLTKTVTLPILGIGAVSLKTAENFEQGMAEVQAISGATGEDLDRLSDKAKEMGAKTKFSARESAEAFKYMAMAGWKTTDMLEGIEGVMNLASASGEDLASVSDIVTDALTAFGLQAKDSAHFADVLAKASSNSNTNVGLMGETFKYVAPVAGALGYSVEDTAVAIGLMANAGIKGSQAGTSLRAIMSRLVKPTRESSEAIEELGIEITNADGTMKPLSETIVNLREKFQGLTDEQKAHYATLLAGQEGMSGLLSIINASDEDFNNLTNQINNASGASKEMSDVMMDTTEGAIIKLKSALESAGIVIGEKLTPYIRKLAEGITKAVDGFNSLSEEQQDMIVKATLMLAVAGPLLKIGSKGINVVLGLGKSMINTGKYAGQFINALKLSKMGLIDLETGGAGALGTISKLHTGLGALVSPLGLVTVGMGAVIGVVAYGSHKTQEYLDTISELTEQEQFLADSISEQKEKYDSISETRNKAIKSAEDEAIATQSLVDKLKDVVDENGTILAGKESYAEFITGELSDALGQEISIVDGQIQGYKDLMSTIDDVILKQKAKAIQEATAEDYKNAIVEQTKAQQNYAEQLQAVYDQEQKVEDAKKKVNEQTTLYGKMMAEQELGAEYEHLDKLKKGLDDASTSLEGYNQTVENYEGLSASLISGDADEIALALLKVQNSFLTAETATKESLQNQVKNVNKQYEDMKVALKEGVPGVTQEMVDQIGMLVEQADAELEQRIAQDKELIKQRFAELGIEAPQSFIDEFYNKEPEAQQAIMNMFTNMENGVTIKSEDIQKLFDELGVDAPDALIKELGNKEPSVQASAIKLLLQLQNAESSKRPEIKEQLKQLGIDIDDSLATGIESNTGTVVSQAGELGTEANNEIEEKVKPDVDAPRIKEIENASSVGQTAWQSIQNFFSNNPITATINAVKNAINGSHANGLDYVPFDGYIAELHKGERVLTKEENEQFNRGVKGISREGDTFNFYNVQPDAYEYARQMKRAKRELLYNI